MTRTRVDRREWDRMVRQYTPAVEATLAQVNEKSAKAMVNFMKRIVPVETGTLRRSIRSEALSGSQQGSWAVHAGGPTTERRSPRSLWNYARIEYGTTHIPEDPYVRPARTRIRRQHRNRVRRAMRALARQFSGRP